MTGPVVRFRRALTELVDQLGALQTYGHQPDDVACLPCYVVGRPAARESSTPAVMTMTADVRVVGRRMNDADAQAELDTLADELFAILGGTRVVNIEGVGRLACRSFIPDTVFVAGLEYPSYRMSVSMDHITC
jgi:hypothetical protein